jgi:hypothetical protein
MEVSATGKQRQGSSLGVEGDEGGDVPADVLESNQATLDGRLTDGRQTFLRTGNLLLFIYSLGVPTLVDVKVNEVCRQDFSVTWNVDYSACWGSAGGIPKLSASAVAGHTHNYVVCRACPTTC